MTLTVAHSYVRILACALAGFAVVFGSRGDTPATSSRPDLIIADFEGPDFGSWAVAGTAFGAGPAHGALPNQMPVAGFMGRGFASSYHGSDRSVGRLTSSPFKIERKYLQFLIGGGGWAGKTCINLLCDGKPVRSATGPNTRPGGSEQLEWQAWDVSRWEGKEAVLEIVDQATEGWGHVSIDHIIQSDQKRPGLILVDVTLPIPVEKRYLNLPVKNGARKRTLQLLRNGETQREFDIELADDKPDWWAFLDLRAFKGLTLTLHVSQLSAESQALTLIGQSDGLKEAGHLYGEALRPQFHYSARRGWHNDPNGLVFYLGEYHLFYQHNPYGWDWGNMHWGHATSRDLVHWTEQPEALYPDRMGTMYSGSAVVDWKNTSGFGKEGQPPLVLIYTAAGDLFTQCLAYSTDGGRTFTKYAKNPIVNQITGGNRDPKVFWHEPSQRWVTVLWVEHNRQNTMQFLTSPNLKDWTEASQVNDFFECPDFFELPVDDDPANLKWVLTAASGEYQVGSFDGRKFRAETAKLPSRYGDCFYAAQTFNDLPTTDGRRVQLGWLRAASPGMPFNQCMSVPQELKLVSTPDGVRLTREPVKELAQLRSKTDQAEAFSLKAGEANPKARGRGELLELRATFEPAADSEVQFTVRGANIHYDARQQALTVNGLRASAPLREGKQRLIIYVDRTATEVFASDGLTYVPLPFRPKADDLEWNVQVKGGDAKFDALQVHTFHSMWEQTGH